MSEAHIQPTEQLASDLDRAVKLVRHNASENTMAALAEKATREVFNEHAARDYAVARRLEELADRVRAIIQQSTKEVNDESR